MLLVKHQKFRRSAKIALLLAVVVILFVTLIASWTPQSRMSSLAWVPAWLSRIADFDPNLRTAIPFIPLSLVLSLLLNHAGARHPARGAFLFCAFWVSLAEIGQFFLPARTADLRDVAWGCLGAIAGLGIRELLPLRHRLPRFLMTQPKGDMADWIVCQIGAREHYTVPRALNKAGRLDLLLTDIWNQPRGPASSMIANGRMFQRWHSELSLATVWAPNRSSLIFESIFRARNNGNSWDTMMRRNQRFQKHCLRFLQEWEISQPSKTRTVFAFSYAALEVFKFAKARGWTTVLGQIDPGPHEEILVSLEHGKYPESGSTWHPAPAGYWASWREEISLADRIVVNSQWACDGLIAAGAPAAKIQVIPLVYDPEDKPSRSQPRSAISKGKVVDTGHDSAPGPLEVLFIGNVCLRKGIARLIDAMRLLRDDPVRLKICGPLSVSRSLWQDLPNVEWAEAVQNTDIRATYEAADVFILPTISDGFARTQLEALAAGTPVIATRNCGDVVIDGVNGYLLFHNSPDEIAALLRSIAKDRNLLMKCNTQLLPAGSPRTLDELAARLIAKE